MCWLGRVRWVNTGRCPLLLLLVWHRLLCLWLVFLFLIPRFSAVLNFGQELADGPDLLFLPGVNAHAPSHNGFRRWYFPGCDVSTQGGAGESEPFRCLIRRDHSEASITDR